MSNRNDIEVSRRQMIRLGIAGTAGLATITNFNAGFPAGMSQVRRRPNVIIFHTDDQMFNTLGCYGGNVLTPHSDTLASGGICFDRGYTTTGVCLPSRYGLLTGQFPSRCVHPSFVRQYPKGVSTEPLFNTPMVHGQHNIASVLKKSGYVTGFVGKWGLAGLRDGKRIKTLPVSKEWAGAWKETRDDVDPSDPKISAILEHNHNVYREEIKDYGFDYAESIYWGNPEGFSSRSMNYHNPEWITEGALNFINQYSDKPFFLHINHTLHHIPHPQESILNADPRATPGGYLDRKPDVMLPRGELLERVKAAGLKAETAYCTWLDDSLGAVLNRLAELGLTDDTMILFISDNQVPAKGTIYEGGVNVPCIIRYPRRVPGGRCSSSLVQNLDFTPTIFEACGVQPSQDMFIDGKSLLPMLTGAKEKIHDNLFFEIGWTRAVCTKRWKYLALRYSEAAEKFRENKSANGFGWIYHTRILQPHQHNALLWHPAFYYPDQLYDLSIDSEEITNLAGNQKFDGVLDDMKQRLKGWLNTFNHPFGEFT